jgi:glycosyltransferase involved in cell wall biosynthesis
MEKISVCILTHNDEDMIAAAIDSSAWADEIVVVDNASTDGTIEIAKKKGVTVVSAIFEGFGALRNQAAAAAKYEWIFSLDADERFTPECRDEILTILMNNPVSDVYRVPRRNWFMGRWLKGSGWYPDFRAFQLFRKGSLTYTNDMIHEGVNIATLKPIGKINNCIHHYSFSNINELLNKVNLFSTLGAQKMGDKSTSMISALIHGIWAFLRLYFIKGGFLNGWPGFILAMSNFEGTFYRYAKLFEFRQDDWAIPMQSTLSRPTKFMPKNSE